MDNVGEMTDRDYYAKTRDLLEDAYLAAGDPRGQSGFSGDDAKWERGRRPITAAMDRDGTFLDIGCASGYLMESVVAWCAEGGITIEPHGLDLIASLADLARRRLPHWADRIHAGNAMAWEPPRQFDYVRTELVYVPEERRPDLVARLLNRFLLPGGRAIICSYGSSRRPEPAVEPVGDLLRTWGFDVAGESIGTADNGVPLVGVAWIERLAD